MAKAAKVEAIGNKHDESAMRVATKAALAEGTPSDDVAESIVAHADVQLLAGNTAEVDRLMFNAVHDGVPAHKLFEQIKAIARKPKEA